MLDSLIRLLGGERPNEIIWTADLEYWVSGQRYAGTLKPEYDGEKGRLRLSHELGILPYFWYEQFWLAEPVYQGITVETKQREDETVRSWITPIGRLEERITFVKESCSQAYTKHPAQDERELEILLYILEHRQLKPTCLDSYADRCELYAGYDGIPAIAMPRSPFSALAVEWCGMENLVYLLIDHPDIIRRILRAFEAQERPILEAICETAPVLLHFADNLTSEFYSSFFDEYMAGPYRKRLEVLHSANVKCAVHLDGTVKGLLPKLAEVGFDAIEAITPMPAGDVRVEEIPKLVNNDNIILWGGVPGVMFCEPYTWPDVENHIHRLVQSWSDQRFILGVADQVPANGDIEICRKISSMVKEMTI